MVMNLSLIDQGLPGFIVLGLTASAFLLPLIHYLVRRRWVIELYSLLVSGAACTLSWRILGLVRAMGKPLVYSFGGWPPPLGIIYVVDLFSGLLGVVVSSIMFLVIVYSIGYMPGDRRLYLFYTLLLVVEAGMLGCLYTGDFFNLFVMLEVISISSYILVAYYRGDRVAVEASMKYAMYGALATTMYFTAIVFAYGSTGTLNMADLAAKIQGIEFPITNGVFGNLHYGILLFTALMLWAFTFKAALFPNHFWLPDAHAAAPTPVSALLSGLVVKIGVYAIARFIYTIYGVSWINQLSTQIILILGFISAYIGAILMIIQSDLKKFIACSTILNIGYIGVGLGIGTSLGLAASTYHIVNHAISKALLFLSAGLLIKIVGSRNIASLQGLGRRYPVIGIPFAIALLSLAGIPPLNIFMSKFLLYMALIGSNNIPLALILLIPSIISFTAYTRIFYTICIKPPLESNRNIGHSLLNIPSSIPIYLLAITCILLGIGIDYILPLIIMPASNILANTSIYINTVLNYMKMI
ncbi:MAG: cation:proton antiporter [Desulfurococcales archaeon]|nr:cation:proton antiporter [Desulfurococcales archaeon]